MSAAEATADGVPSGVAADRQRRAMDGGQLRAGSTDDPERANNKGAVLLAPGAGADRTQPQLVAIDEALTALGWVVERMDFRYRREGRRAPDRSPVLLAAVQDAAAAVIERTGVAPGDLVLGGRSMGGRICSMAVAEGLPAAGLVLVSYPLHPPGRPDKQPERTRHFDGLWMPCLFVSGTRDAFGTPSELEAATVAVPGPVTHVWLEGGDHGLRGRDREVGRHVAAWSDGLRRP